MFSGFCIGGGMLVQVHLAMYPEEVRNSFWRELSKEMAGEDGILQTRTSPEALRVAYGAGRAKYSLWMGMRRSI